MKDYQVFQNRILNLQSGEIVFYNRESVINESGKEIKSLSNTMNWNNLESLKLGKCGELYAEYIFSCLGCMVYEPMVDDHGVDLLIKHNMDFYRVQVKTVRNYNYTFIKKDNPPIDTTYYLLYVRVLEDKEPQAYLFPMKYVLDKLGRNDGAKHLCFTYREYTNPEIGISSAKKYFEENNGEEESTSMYCISNDWNYYKEKFEAILGLNK